MGCEGCIRKGICHLKDNADEILQKMIEADGIIIGTPIYLRQISGYLKTLIDRGCAWYHRSPVVGKPILFATTTQVTGKKQTLNYLKDLSIQWGTIYSGEISRNLFNKDKPISSKKLSKFKKYLIKDNRRKYKPSFKQLTEFVTQKVLAESILPMDLKYWQENGYINMPYFYKCRINFIYRFICFLYYKFLSWIINKNKTESV